MNHYEILYIVSGIYADNEVDTHTKRVDDLIKKYGGTIHFSQRWGRKKLSYPINHQPHGYYVYTEFDMGPDGIHSLEKEMRLSQEVLRHQVLRRETVGQPNLSELHIITEPAMPIKTAAVPAPAGLRVEMKDMPKDVEIPSEEEAASPQTAEAPAAPLPTDSVNKEELEQKLDDILKNEII